MNRSRNVFFFFVLNALILSFSLITIPDPVDAAGCHQCHGSKNPPDLRPVDASFRNSSSGGFPGNHRTHLGAGSTTPDSCTRCHGNSGYTSGHRDGKIQIVDNINNSSHPDKAGYFKNGSNAVFFNQTTVPVLGSCTNVNCHFESATPAWGSPSFTAPGDCGKCHSANPVTGSHPATGGKHAGIACESCHGNHATFSHATSVKLRVQFSPVPGGQYTGNLTKFLPSQSAGKTYGECRNVYCHSDGTAAANGVIGRSGNMYGNYTTPVWGGSLVNNCKSCHDYPPDYGQAYYVKSPDPQWAAWAGPKANRHGIRWHYDEPCSSCHYATTTDGTTIADPKRHGNGVYDVVPGPDIGFRYDYDPAGGTCSTVMCHGGYAHPHDEEPWGDSPYSLGLLWPVKIACRTYKFFINENDLYTSTNYHWPDIPPVTVKWDFGDGSTATGSFSVSHKYEQPGNYRVSVTVRDKIQHLSYADDYLTVDNRNVKPVPNVTASVDGMTVTLTDLSRDPDYNECGHSGPGTVYINWNYGSAPFSQPIALTDLPSNITFQHVYQTAGAYNITYQIKDNQGETFDPQISLLTVQVPSGSTVPLSTFKGHVTDHVTGNALPGVTVQLKNPQAVPNVVGTTTTDDFGYYEFTNYPLDITYTVAVAKEGYQFTPSSKTAWLSSQYAGKAVVNDFHTSAPDTEPKINIAGRVTDGNGNSVQAYISLLKGDVPVKTTSSDYFTGTYSFGDVDDDCYTVKAANGVGDVFAPASREVCFTDGNVDFTHSTVGMIKQITGSVQDDSGAGMSNVKINLKDADGKVMAAAGSGNGAYAFSVSAAAEGCYTLEPKKYGYTFVPPYKSICGAAGESIDNQNFVGQPTAPLITIGGRISAENNGSLYYPAIYLKKDGMKIYQAPSKASTGSIYDYVFEQVPQGCYTVEPIDERYIFTPPSREVCDTSSTVDFTSMARETMDIRGEVYNVNGIPLRYPVTVNFKDSWGSQLPAAVTSATNEGSIGQYMTTIRKDCVTVEPAAGPFTFTPPIQAICQSTTNVNFKATDTRFRVKGRITDQAGTGLANTTLNLQDSQGTVIRSQQTNSTGYYSFGKLDNACYTVVPAAGQYPYSPVSVQVCGENTNLDFTAITAGSQTVATTLDSTSINVTWLDSADESGYAILRCSGPDCTEFTEIATVGANITQFRDASVCSGSSYTYRIKAFKTGEWERLSDPASASTPAPAAPTDLVASAQSETRTMLTWNYAGSDLSGFRIERCGGTDCTAFSQVVTVAAGVRTFFDSGFVPGSYTYRVRAYKDAACPWTSESSNSASVSTATPSLDGLTVTVPDTTSTVVSWTDNSVTATGYKLERCSGVGCGNFSEIASFDKDPAALIMLNMDEPAWNGVADEVMDSSGNNRHGKAFNGATTAGGGKFGRAGSFDGVDGYIAAGVDGRSLYQWSIEMWVKPAPLNSSKAIFQWGDSTDPATSTPFIRLIHRYDSTVEWDYSYYIGGSRPSTGQSYTGVTTAPDNQWTHLVLTYDGTYLRSYGNGVAIGSPTQTNLVQNDKALVALFGAGKGYSTGATYYNGLVDGAIIYRRALPPAEVVARYQGGSDLSVCSATTYQYRVKAVNKGLSNAGGSCWSKRAPLAITNYQPNFQTRVVIPYAPGMKSTFDDIRFYDAAAGRELPYWLDTRTDGVTATFWVRTGDSSSIYVYYGNAAATSSSNGKATFERFDDFSSTVSSYSDWYNTSWYYYGYRNDITLANGLANFRYYAGDSDMLETGINLNMDFHAQVKLNSYSVNDKTLAGIAAYDTSTAYTFGRYRNDATSTNGFRAQKSGGTQIADYADTTAPAYMAMRKSGTSYSFFLSHDNATWIPVGGAFTGITPTFITIGSGLTTSTNNSNFTMDDFYVRKYVATEPTAAIGAEEALASCRTLGWENPYSDTLTVTTPTPGAPTNVSLKVYDTEIDLSWNRNTSDETGFKIERCQGVGCGNFSQIGTVTAGVTSYNDVGLVLGTSYSYRVKAYKTATCGWETPYSDVVTATTAVQAPQVTATTSSTTQVGLSWVDMTRSETSFSVERCQGEGCSDFTPISTVVGTSFTDTATCTGNTYSYRVSAVSAGLSNSGGGCWQKRRLLTISNFQPNYQMGIRLSNETGMRADFADVRFYDATAGKELPYWVESKSDGYTGLANIYVKTGDSNNIYVYFGNPSATSSSNGKAVFEVFDEFDDGVIDTNLWTVLPGNGTIGESGGALKFTYAGAANDWSLAKGRQATVIRLKTLPAYDFAAAVKVNSYTALTSQAGMAVYGSDSAAYLWGRYSGPPEDYGLARLDGTLIGSYSATALPEVFVVKRRGPSYSFHFGGASTVLTQKGNVYNDVPFNGLVLFGKEWGSATLSFGMEFFYLRKLAATEPAVTNMGTVEQATLCGLTWTSAYSSPVSVTMASPVPPNTLTAAAVTPTRINLSWKQSSDETGFRIERCGTEGCTDFAEIATVGADVTTYSDASLVTGTSYSYRVRGYKTTPACSWVSDYSNTATAVVALAPPAGLTATVVSGTLINLSWSDTADAGTGFKIERCTGSGCTDFTEIASVKAHTTSYPDNSVVAGTPYSYRIRGWAGSMFTSGGGCWTKKTNVYISSNFQPNYQMTTQVNDGLYYSPTMTPGLKPDFGDVRFFDETSRQELPYFVQKVVPSSGGAALANIWIKTGANNNISMYFGNQNATTVSSGEKTFEFYDDFSDGSLGPLWTPLTGNGTVTESGGAVNFSYDGAADNTWTTSGRNNAALLLNTLPAGDFFAQVKLNGYVMTDQSFAGIGVYGSDASAYLFGQYSTSNTYGVQKNDGITLNSSYLNSSPSYLGIKRSGGQYSFWLSSSHFSVGSQVGGFYNDIPFNGIALLGKETGASGMSFSMGPVYIRKLAPVEPTYSVRADYPLNVLVCTDAWDGPYSNEVHATTTGGQ